MVAAYDSGAQFIPSSLELEREARSQPSPITLNKVPRSMTFCMEVANLNGHSGHCIAALAVLAAAWREIRVSGDVGKGGRAERVLRER